MYKSNQVREIEEPGNTEVARLVFPYMGKNLQPRFIVNGKELPFTDRDPQEIKDHFYNT